MPCFTPEPTPKEIAESNRNSNKLKYGFRMTDSELIAHLLNMCCEMGGELEAEGIEDRLTPETLKWYENHKKRDAEKRRAEITQKLSLKCKQYEQIESDMKHLSEEIKKLKDALNSNFGMELITSDELDSFLKN